jgi:rhodanese-related sulfurtransferase
MIVKRATRLIAWLVLVAASPSTVAMAGHGRNATLVLDVAYVKAQYDRGRMFTAIDLRPVEEYRKGHLPGARSLPQAELQRRFEEIPRVDLVVLYCECPQDEAETAHRFLRSQNFRNLSVMAPGFNAWVEHGYPIER